MNKSNKNNHCIYNSIGTFMDHLDKFSTSLTYVIDVSVHFCFCVCVKFFFSQVLFLSKMCFFLFLAHMQMFTGEVINESMCI